MPKLLSQNLRRVWSPFRLSSKEVGRKFYPRKENIRGKRKRKDERGGKMWWKSLPQFLLHIWFGASCVRVLISIRNITALKKCFGIRRARKFDELGFKFGGGEERRVFHTHLCRILFDYFSARGGSEFKGKEPVIIFSSEKRTKLFQTKTPTHQNYLW